MAAKRAFPTAEKKAEKKDGLRAGSTAVKKVGWRAETKALC